MYQNSPTLKSALEIKMIYAVFKKKQYCFVFSPFFYLVFNSEINLLCYCKEMKIYLCLNVKLVVGIS